MQIKKYLLIPFVFAAAAGLSAQTESLLNDTFTSGATGTFNTTGNPGIGTQSPPTSAEWFGIGSSTAPGAAETYTNGAGITNAPTADQSNSQGVIAYFEAPGSQVTLGVGQTLTESMTFQYASAPASSAFGLHMLLLNSGSTGSGAGQNNQTLAELGTTTVNGTVAATNYSGYYIQLNPDPSASAASGIFYRPTGSTTSWVGSNNGSTELGGTPGPQTASLTTDPYKLVLSVTETTPTLMTLTASLEDMTTDTFLSAYNLTETTSSIVDSFDTFAIGLGSANPQVTISDASVNVSIPEPSTYAAILGVATLGFVAIRGMRKRRQIAA